MKTPQDDAQTGHLSLQRLQHQSIPSRYQLVLSSLKGSINVELGYIADNRLTVRFALIPLVTNTAHKLGNTFLSVNSYSDRFIVVTK